MRYLFEKKKTKKKRREENTFLGRRRRVGETLRWNFLSFEFSVLLNSHSIISSIPPISFSFFRFIIPNTLFVNSIDHIQTKKGKTWEWNKYLRTSTHFLAQRIIYCRKPNPVLLVILFFFLPWSNFDFFYVYYITFLLLGCSFGDWFNYNGYAVSARDGLLSHNLHCSWGLHFVLLQYFAVFVFNFGVN